MIVQVVSPLVSGRGRGTAWASIVQRLFDSLKDIRKFEAKSLCAADDDHCNQACNQRIFNGRGALFALDKRAQFFHHGYNFDTHVLSPPIRFGRAGTVISRIIDEPAVSYTMQL